jgi:hypothetical protein
MRAAWSLSAARHVRSHRQLIDAILYPTDNGIKWRAMPADFPTGATAAASSAAGRTRACSPWCTTGCAAPAANKPAAHPSPPPRSSTPSPYAAPRPSGAHSAATRRKLRPGSRSPAPGFRNTRRARPRSAERPARASQGSTVLRGQRRAGGAGRPLAQAGCRAAAGVLLARLRAIHLRIPFVARLKRNAAGSGR